MTNEAVSDVVGSKIREARKALRWRMADLAIRCAQIGHDELTASIIGDIETGRRHPDGTRRRQISVDELVAIAQALKVSPVELLPGDSIGDMKLANLEDIEQLANSLQAFVSLQKFRGRSE